MKAIKISIFFTTVAVFFVIGSMLFLWSASSYNEAGHNYLKAPYSGEYEYYMNKGHDAYQKGDDIDYFAITVYLPYILPFLIILSFCLIFKTELKKLKNKVI